MKNKLISLVSNIQILDTNNLNNVRLRLLFAPFLMLVLIGFIYFVVDAFSVEAYIHTQKEISLFLNAKLSQFPSLQYNLTQMGDVLIFLSFLTLFMIYAPKFWEATLIALLVSCIFCSFFKKLFAVPRPAAMFDQNSFVIIGETLTGSTSLPSGHTIATFTILTTVLFAFMPKSVNYKTIWVLFVVIIGLIIAFTRVGVGAHYPIDVIVGSILGYISGVIGICINNKWNILTWVTNKKYYLVSIILFSVWAIVLFYKILALNLAIFYFSLASLTVTLFLIVCLNVKKQY